MGSGLCKESTSVEAETKIMRQQNGTFTPSADCKSKVIMEQQPDGGDFIEKIICNDTDINENEMKQFDLTDDSKILLIKQKGKLSAIGTKCSHYGALLSTGALGDGRLRCPWHGACFNIHTGDIEDFPGQDSIPCYRVTIVDQNKVKIRAKRSELEANRRFRDMAVRDPKNERTFIVIGGGPSGAICVETLRQEGFTGRIVMIAKEDCLPYDRVKVSKAMDFNIEKTQYRTQGFYDQYGIEVMKGCTATGVNTTDNTVSCDNGYIIKYDKLYIATGSMARKLNVPGSDLKNVVTMRNYTDAHYVHNLLSADKHIVCFGLSFISLEAAAYCRKHVAKVTVVGRDTIPLRHSFGPEIGKRIMEFFQENGIEFIMENGLKQCVADSDGNLTSVELRDGQILKCDLCIMGTGSTLYTKFLNGSTIQCNPDGSIDTNEYLQSNVPDVYVGGDIANAPVLSINNERATIGHYPLAQYHGRIAGKNMVNGNQEPMQAVPFFWTMLFGKSFRYSGYGVPHEIRIEGNLDELKYVAFYMDKNGNVCGLSSCQRDPIVSQYAEYVAQGKKLHKNDLAVDPFGWVSSLNK